MVIASNIDDIINTQANLKKIAIEIIHPKLLSWLSSTYPRALHNMDSAKKALNELVGLGSGAIEGVSFQDLTNLRQELMKVIKGVDQEPGVHDIGAA